MKVERIQETCLYAEDLEATEIFYTELLGLELYAKVADHHVFFRCGPQMLLVFDPTRSAREGRRVPSHGARGPGHVAFAVRETDLDAWSERLKKLGVEIEDATDWSSGRGRSVYFRDPAGNSVELITPSSWHVSEAEVFGDP